MQETQEPQVQSLDQEDSLEKEMATHSSNLVWRIPWQRSLEGCSPWGHKELDMTGHAHAHTHARTHTHTHIPHSVEPMKELSRGCISCYTQVESCDNSD